MSVGLDIGSRTIKIVELGREGAGFKLVSSGIMANPVGPVSQIKEDKNLAVLADAIRKLHKEAKIGSKEISLALPEPLVFTRTIKFPLLTDAEIASAVKWEAEQYIPIPINEAIVEHQIIERNETGPSPGVTVLLVASPRALVERYIKLVQASHLTVVGVETEVLALTRALAPATGVVMLLDFGATATEIAIAKNATIRFSRSVPIAGEAFTRALSQGLGVAYPQAEEYKKTYGLSNNLEGKVKATLDPVFNLVAEEIKKAIHFYQTDEKGEVPANVIIAGGTSAMPEVISAITKIVGVEVIVGNPFEKVRVDPASQKNLQNYAPLYSVALGLALRND